VKLKFNVSKTISASIWFVTIALAGSGHVSAVDIVGDTIQGSLTVAGDTTGSGWGLFKQGIDFGNAGEAMLNWVPGTSPAGTVMFDITWADGTFLWRDTLTTTANNKMSLDAANNLLLYKSNGTAGITLAPETGKITLPAGSGTSTGSGIYFGTSPNATIAASATGAAIFPSQVTLQNGLSVSSGAMNIASPTASTSSSTGALTIAGGIGVGKDSYFNGVCIGRGAGNTIGNTALGAFTLNANTTGFYNSATGYRALYCNTTGRYNSATGSDTLMINTTGSGNSATGSNVLYFNTTGSYNSATGFTALRSNTTGNFNSATGTNALCFNTTGNYNSATGSDALTRNTTGSYNSATGSSALYRNTTGSNNVGFGNEAGLGNATGILNVFLGASAGKFQANGTTSLGTTNRSIYIGANSRGSGNLDDNSIVIGADAIGQGANTTVLGNSLTEKTSVFGQTTLTNNPWKTRIVTVSPLADPTPATNDSDGNALVVDGHTVLNGKVIISVPQGDISMGIYQ
jgi:hypothetical protein